MSPSFPKVKTFTNTLLRGCYSTVQTEITNETTDDEGTKINYRFTYWKLENHQYSEGRDAIGMLDL